MRLMILEIDAVAVKLGLNNGNYVNFLQWRKLENVTQRNDYGGLACREIYLHYAEFPAYLTYAPHQCTRYVSILYVQTERAEGRLPRARVFRRASQEITLLSSNSVSIGFKRHRQQRK